MSIITYNHPCLNPLFLCNNSLYLCKMSIISIHLFSHRDLCL
ncbi:hypothetical protein MtrunA17_Chr5g0398361 [Medicago truncatula]|uniref:Uncharacterized protein n=1 Tax=Medicago truncatula TaxID=3880 RepID=A0A396HMF3_MEDTR|nr:hypothetical protein MtrunA17_Chr5g0398361 [Medicago truncatula]